MAPFSYRRAAQTVLASGVIGIVAYACLMVAVTSRTSVDQSPFVFFMFRAHDVGIILQFMLLIPIALTLHELSQQKNPSMSRASLYTAIGSLTFTILTLLLVFPKIISDTIYQIPQAAFGVWLVLVNWRLSGIFPQWLRWFGMIVGLGLTLVGCFPLGYAIFVDFDAIFHIPAIEPTEYPDTFANNFIHQLLWIGTFMGVLTLPLWSIIVGFKLLREEL